MKTFHDVIIKPLVLTEKGEILKEENNQYFFKVAFKSTKPEIKSAIEKLFKVNVKDVNTMIVRGKPGRLGRHVGKRPNWKKAVVTLHDGDEIEFFEGA
ncbi:MAG: 50S ribosomal protein L23 [Deltaproteobacteria bacterium]|jgi:large subunit ribosomal protein L23|nr:50S ribosomal protein L23 [Deltaproteobacteria bacterium]